MSRKNKNIKKIKSCKIKPDLDTYYFYNGSDSVKN